MKSVIIVQVVASVQVSATQDLLNQTASFPPFVTTGSEIPSCPAQQQQEATLREFRRMITSNLATLTQCGGEDWTRVAYLNMSDPMQFCPPAWRDRSANRVRVCGLPAGSFHECNSTFFSTGDHSYTKVCGQVIGYQFGSPDGFKFRSTYTVNQPYVDGVSITHGSPRSHIWTLAAHGSESNNGCPCEGSPSAPPVNRAIMVLISLLMSCLPVTLPGMVNSVRVKVYCKSGNFRCNSYNIFGQHG